MATAKTKKAGPKTQGDWSVIDLNVLNPKCETKTRQHEVLDAKSKMVHKYDLPGSLDKETRRGCPMPPDHALTFLCDPAYKVYDADGELVQPLKPQTTTHGISLQRNETIATYQELTRDALFNRVKRLPGGPLVPMNTTNAKLIEILMTGGAPGTERVQDDNDKLEVDDGDDDTEIELEGPVGGDAALTDGLAARAAEVRAQITGGKQAAPGNRMGLEDASLG